MLPPPRLWVFSTQTIFEGGKCWSGGRRAVWRSAAVKMPRMPGRQRQERPDNAAGPPAS